MKIGAERAKDRKRERKKECVCVMVCERERVREREMPPKRADSCQRQVKPYTLRESVIGSFPIRFNVILFFFKTSPKCSLSRFSNVQVKEDSNSFFFYLAA
jgi:hypothetical protein